MCCVRFVICVSAYLCLYCEHSMFCVHGILGAHKHSRLIKYNGNIANRASCVYYYRAMEPYTLLKRLAFIFFPPKTFFFQFGVKIRTTLTFFPLCCVVSSMFSLFPSISMRISMVLKPSNLLFAYLDKWLPSI